MGWSSWNEYACEINETVFLEVGSLLKDLGLADLGYSYVNIDDCWSDKEYQRDNVTGKIRPHYGKFPGGIKHTADKIHELGLKLGIYGDAGTATCAGYAGSLEHEAIDAETFAEWGIDCTQTLIANKKPVLINPRPKIRQLQRPHLLARRLPMVPRILERRTPKRRPNHRRRRSATHPRPRRLRLENKQYIYPLQTHVRRPPRNKSFNPLLAM
jgi:hypothetical protein